MAHEFAAALGAKPIGRGKWKVRCIAHEERTPSLYIRESGERTLFKCWGGCDQSAIIDALRARGLWSGGSSSRRADLTPWPKPRDVRELQWLLDDVHLLDEQPGATQVWTFLKHAAGLDPLALDCVSRALRKHRPACQLFVRQWFYVFMLPAEETLS